VVTAGAIDATVSRLAPAGCLRKPLHLDELLAAIERL
jgi:hypothetical protein